nr:hypothetical protein B0A51_10219 [Rachicladosporium sp. CCFEE 5018]
MADRYWLGGDGTKYCSSCDNEATQICARCNVAKFCGDDECGNGEEDRPDHCLALYFPEPGPKPRFIWLPTRNALPEEVIKDEGQSLDAMKPSETSIAALIAPDGSPIGYHGIQHHGDIAYKLEHHSLGCYSRAKFISEHENISKTNDAVVVATKPQEDLPIREENFGAKGGFVWVVGDKEGDTQDVLMITLRRVVDYYSRVSGIWERGLRDKIDSPWSMCN